MTSEYFVKPTVWRTLFHHTTYKAEVSRWFRHTSKTQAELPRRSIEQDRFLLFPSQGGSLVFVYTSMGIFPTLFRFKGFEIAEV